MSEHVLPQRVYYAVFACLIALTVLTVWLSFMELGPWHVVIGLAIATCKASLVAMFFMRVLSSGRLVWLIFGAGLFWLAILISLTMTDYLTRPWLAY
jgi:cytochrome c oxidase subunit IV